MPKLNINSLHVEVLHYSQLIYFYAKQSRYLFNRDQMEFTFQKVNCVLSAKEYIDSVFHYRDWDPV